MLAYGILYICRRVGNLKCYAVRQSDTPVPRGGDVISCWKLIDERHYLTLIRRSEILNEVQVPRLQIEEKKPARILVFRRPRRRFP